MKNIIKKLLVLYLILIWFSCNQKSAPLNSFFIELRKEVNNENTINQFKRIHRDSAVVNYQNYSEIFHEGFANVLKDSTYTQSLEHFCQENEIDLNSRKGVFMIVALFHSYLNIKTEDLEKLKNDMELLSGWVEEEKFLRWEKSGEGQTTDN